jgi:HemY protein
MGRVLLFGLKFAVVLVIAAWLAEWPGRVTAELPGYRLDLGFAVLEWPDLYLDTSVGVLVLALVGLAISAALAYRFWRFLRRAPRDLNLSVRAGRRRRGYQALTQGMVAVAAGEREEAERWARKAGALLDEPPLTMLLSAQAAQLSGDEAAARRYFTAMLDSDETRFLGLRGLLTQALREGEQGRALELVREAHGLRPRTPWVLQSLFDLTERGGDLEAAESALRESLRAKALPKAETTRMRAVVLLERALAARRAGDSAATTVATGHAREAHKLAPDLIPASALFAELLLDGGEARKAAKAIEEAWARAPHPDLAALYLRARPNDDSLERLKTLGKLVARNPAHAESHLARGRAALQARLWGEARRHLEAAAGPGGLDGNPREAVCRLMAELEESERADIEAARAWLARAATAPPDPAWVCGSCGASAASWRPRCGKCESFDTLAWTAPPHVAAAPEIAAPARETELPALAAPEEAEQTEAPAPPALTRST